ncbi:hypothetical protein BH09CHL1_BH09CHL1_16090 [soil metagenome]
MDASEMGSTITRRAFTGIAAINLAAGIAIAHQCSGYAQGFTKGQESKLVYAFAPIENGQPTTCAACRLHAANKRFTSIQAARENRAHPGCTCAIYAIPVSAAEHTRMFGEALERNTHDLRSR